MRRSLLLFVFAIVAMAGMADIFDTPIKTYPDGISVYRMFKYNGSDFAIMMYGTGNGMYTYGILNPQQITPEVRKSENKKCPYKDLIIYGRTFTSTGKFVGEVMYGETTFMDSTKHLKGKDLTTVKEWNDETGRQFLFYANGTGLMRYELQRGGYAQQVQSGRAQGSNQYATRHKSYGATGGITGGYSYDIYMDVSHKLNWKIKNDSLFITLIGAPTYKETGVNTSMDGDRNQKTPTMKAYQWVRVDLKYNNEVAATRNSMVHSIKNAEKEIVAGAIKAFNDKFIYAGKKFFSYEGSGYEYPEKVITGRNMRIIHDDAERLANYLSFKRQVLSAGEHGKEKKIIQEYVLPMLSVKDGKYNAKNLPSWLDRSANIDDIGRCCKIEGYHIKEKTALKQLKNIQSFEVVKVEVDSRDYWDDKERTMDPVVKYTCKFEVMPNVKKGIKEVYTTDIVVLQDFLQPLSSDRWLVLFNKSFNRMDLVQ